MEDYIKIGAVYFVIPNDFENIVNAKLYKFNDNKLLFKLCEDKFHLQNDDSIELFSSGNKGILYFCSTVLNCDENNLIIKNPVEYEIIQRRENERVVINEKMLIYDGNKEIEVILSDLSVGGMKLLTKKELRINNIYKIAFNLDNSNLSFNFIPLRISYEDEIYKISGKIDIKDSISKIELIQFCYRKIFEQTNRN